MHTLYIVRGLPGSGKSTFSKKLSAHLKIEHWENDQFLYDGDQYVWTKPRYSRAVEMCIRNVTDALWSNQNVIVSNVFLTWYALEDYLDVVERVGCKLVIIEATADYGSIHGCPDDTLKHMKKYYWPNDRMIKYHSELEYKNVEFKKVEDYAFEETA